MYKLNEKIKRFYCEAGCIKAGGTIKEKWFTPDKFKELLKSEIIVNVEQEKKVSEFKSYKSEKKED